MPSETDHETAAETVVVSCLVHRGRDAEGRRTNAIANPWGRIVTARPPGWRWSERELREFIVIDELEAPLGLLDALHDGGLAIDPADPAGLTGDEVVASERTGMPVRVRQRIAPDLKSLGERAR
jgi:hypothetical protein